MGVHSMIITPTTSLGGMAFARGDADDVEHKTPKCSSALRKLAGRL